NQPGTSHQIPQKMPVFPHFPPKTFELPTSRFPQNVDCRTGELVLGNALVIGASTLVIPGFAGLSLQKINFSVSAALKQPPLQMNDLRRFSPETDKNAETPSTAARPH